MLRLRTLADRLRLGVCWMLTEPDGRTDGKFLNYLHQPEKYRHRDPDLFDWLKQAVGMEQDRRTARIEAAALLGSVLFMPGILADHKDKRRVYFSDCGVRFTGCDLVFFDPDNGLEIRSTQRGHKDSCKFLYWDEVCGTFDVGSSVLIYQHFIREERSGYIARMAAELQRRTQAATVLSFKTPHVLFLLAAQERHASGFRNQVPVFQSLWAPKQIIAAEHAPIPDARLLSTDPDPKQPWLTKAKSPRRAIARIIPRGT